MGVLSGTAGWNMRAGTREGGGESREGSIGRTGSQKARDGVLPDAAVWESGTEELVQRKVRTKEGSWLEERWEGIVGSLTAGF